MKAKRERFILGGVLGVAAAGFAVDRIFLGGGFSGPQSVGAAEVAPKPAEKRQATAPEPAPGPEQPETLTQRFERFAAASGHDVAEIGDAMNPEGRMVKAQAVTVATSDPVERFTSTYELGLVMGSPGGPYTAYLKNRSQPMHTIRVQEGGVIEEFTLDRIEVDPTTGGAIAYFQRDGRTVALSRSNSP